jgi:CheY-like chemotaxis protein
MGTRDPGANVAEPTRGSVLIVDDEPEMVRVLQAILQEEGYATRTATEGNDAVKLYSDARPDGVLLDIGMPRMGGIEVLCALRQMDPDARIAILSGDTKRKVIHDAMQAGARDFILKPFDVSQVLSVVENLVAA